MKTAELIIDSAEKNADLYYATGLTNVPDAFIYFKANGKKFLIMSDLEIDRARKNAKTCTVLSLTKYLKLASSNCKTPSSLDAVIVALKERMIKNILAPESMSFSTVDYLRRNGFKVLAGPTPFYQQRLKKSPLEFKHLLTSQKVVFSAMKLAENMIKKAGVKKNILHLGGKVLTSERVRDAIQLFLLENGYIITDGTIVSCGNDATEPHNVGSGPLRAHESIIVDIFPRSMKTLYYGDATRTFCKGEAPAKLKRMYNVVRAAQIDAIKHIKAGMNGKRIHQNILDYFDDQGYRTGEKRGLMQGFFHSTGHGIGLQLHEAPRIGPVDTILKDGFITSVEPGLYYKGIGGVRIEDLVYITKTGCKVLGSYPKKLEIK